MSARTTASTKASPPSMVSLASSDQMRKSMVLDDEKVGNMMQWTTDETVQWLNSVGLGLFEQPFREHMIQGDILPFMNLVELKDMGISLVGPRTYLIKHLSKLKRGYMSYSRNKLIWEGLEQRYESPIEQCMDFLGSCCMPDPPDKYKLTGASLQLNAKVYPMGKMCKCLSKGNTLNTIDLSMIVDIDASSNQTCCGGRDIVYIKDNEGGVNQMFLDLSTGPEVVKMVRDQIENAQQMQKLSAIL